MATHIRPSSLFKFLLKGMAPPFVWDLKRKISVSRYHGLDELDRKIEQYLNYDDGFYVELGANNGVVQSNTHYFENHRNWRGVLVEPSPANYVECRRNRSTLKNSIFCAACVPFDYSGGEFVKIANANLMSAPMNLESDIADPESHAKSGEKFLANHEKVFVYGALARTLTDLLNEANAPKKIDLLSLDVEGAEIAVLKGIDHDRYRFKYMVIECRDIDKMVQYLGSYGYTVRDKLSTHDYLFADVR